MSWCFMWQERFRDSQGIPADLCIQFSQWQKEWGFIFLCPAPAPSFLSGEWWLFRWSSRETACHKVLLIFISNSISILKTMSKKLDWKNANRQVQFDRHIESKLLCLKLTTILAKHFCKLLLGLSAFRHVTYTTNTWIHDVLRPT